MRRLCLPLATAAAVSAMLLPATAGAQAAPTSAFAGGPRFGWTAVNTTRVESWRFFDPPPTGGNPDYTFLANRLRLGVTATWPRLQLNAAGQYVQFGHLPSHASGPGPLGTGALYYDHSGQTDSRGFYVRNLFARVTLPGGVIAQAGRFPYQLGGESASGHPKIEALKRTRIDGRLIGEFEWSLYQRTFDGVRLDVDRTAWHASGAWFVPTQGGFENDAGARLTRVSVGVGTFTLRPSVALRNTDVALFVVRYDDTRPVTARPDNSGLGAQRADVQITTMGASAVGSAATGGGELDWLAWFAGQTGDWYEQRHRAWSLAVEGGYQWQAAWRPWVRTGFLEASGDHDASDTTHQTFFLMLPTVRKYALTAAYAPMNVRDLFVEASVRPYPRLGARADVRRLWLTEDADLWYSGSGATVQRGSIFGFAGRRSGGESDLGTVVEGAGDVTLGPHWSVNGFVGAIRAGGAVRNLFQGDWLTFAYLENTIQF